MLPFPAEGEPGSAQAVGPPDAAELLRLIGRTRPDLPADAPERQGAVLLLLIPAVGLNVDRLVLRTGFPRGFVAQCLRRLVDNAWWTDGEPPVNGCADPLSCPSFWLDVEVALGRRVRRLNEEGRPEWARAGEWVKEFEYVRPQAVENAVHTDYRKIAPYDPEPIPSSDTDSRPGEAEVEPETGPPASRPEVRAQLSSKETPPPGSSGNGSAAGVARKPAATRPADLLLDAWAGAEWLR